MQNYSVEKAIIKINKMLDLIYPNESERYPVDIDKLLYNIHELFHWDEKISQVYPTDIDGFEGALFQNDSNDWTVLFNSEMKSKQRIRFTKAHELGHYVLHRHLQRNCQCTERDLMNQQERDIEAEANKFSSAILMPIYDFRKFTKQPFSFDLIKKLCTRYATSLESVLLKWIQTTDENMLMIVSIDEFMKWSYSSRTAYKANAVFATRKNTIEVPDNSLCKDNNNRNEYDGVKIPIKTWFPYAHTNADLIEYKISQINYDKIITILKLPKYEDVWAV